MLSLYRYVYDIVINVLRALKMTSRMKHKVAFFVFFNQWDLTNLSHKEYASLFIQYNINITTSRLSAQNALNAHECVFTALNELLFGRVLHATTCRK